MTFLPILDRELRVAAKHRATYSGRVKAGGAALGLAFYLVWVARYAMGPGAAGTFILQSISYVSLGLCLFAGINRTCDAISSEKRADTLGLLFLTHLKGRDIVLGKLLANSLHAIFVLLAVLPVLSVPILLGGVAGIEMIRVPIGLLNALFFALSLGLFVSTILKKQRAAFGTAGMVMFIFAVALPALALSLERKGFSPELILALRLPSPVCLVQMSFWSAVGLSTNWFWTTLFIQVFMSVLLLAGACLLIPLCWQQRSPGGAFLRWKERLNQWNFGSDAARETRRRKLLDKNPIYWLCFRDRFAPLRPLAFALITFGAIFWCILHYDIPGEPALLLIAAIFSINDLSMRVRVAGMASMRLAEDRQSGALEMLLSTPLTVSHITGGHWMAIRHTLLWTYFPLSAGYCWFSSLFLKEMTGQATKLGLAMCLSISAGDFIATGYVGFWKAMRVPNAIQAPGLVLLRVMILPWIAWSFALPCIQAVVPLKAWFDERQPYSFLGCAFLFWFASTSSAIWISKRHLRLHFRHSATDRYTLEARVGWRPWLRRVRAFWPLVKKRSNAATRASTDAAECVEPI